MELAGHAEALTRVLAGGTSLFDSIAAWAAFVGVAAGLAGLLLYRGLREALTASREANATLRESLGDEKTAREAAEERHRDELVELERRHATDVAACNLKIEGLTAKVELLQSAWMTEVALAVGQAVATSIHATAPPRRRGGTST